MQKMLADMFKANNEAMLCIACARLLPYNICGDSFNILRNIHRCFINIQYINGFFYG